MSAPRTTFPPPPARRTAAPLGALALTTVVLASCGLGDEPAPQRDRPVVMSAPGPVEPAPAGCGPTAPESTDGSAPREGMTAVAARGYAVSTANPESTAAACRVLAEGGSAADALVAAQAVLTLVEPQSSGFGGGGFALYHDAATGTVRSYDGMETAPAAARPDDLRWVSDDEREAPSPDVRSSGRSIGVPGIVRLLGDLHAEHGRLPWGDSLADATALARDGFTVSPRLASAIRGARGDLRRDEAARDYLMPDGGPVEAGDTLRNPAYADTLRRLGDGPDTFYTGPIARDVTEAVRDDSRGRTPGRMTPEDLADYRVTTDDPLCLPYRDAQIVCGPHAAEAGGVAVLETLGMLAHHELPAPLSAGEGVSPRTAAARLLVQAQRLALADRSAYSADEAYVDPPDGDRTSLLDPGYLEERAAGLSGRSGIALPRAGKAQAPSDDHTEEGTSHISVVDAEGNMASFTTSLQSNFGAYRLVGGFFLNNHLENFSADPTRDGEPVANALAGGKRPRSAMAPTLVYGAREDGTRGDPFLATGSPGGSDITAYVVKNLVAMLDWGLDPQSAASLRNVGATSRLEVALEEPWGVAESDDEDRVDRALASNGPSPRVGPLPSGASTLLLHDGMIVGGADPRREGEVRGGA